MNAPLPHPPAVRTTCPYCGVGCGVIAQPDGRGGAVDRRRSRRIRRISADSARRAPRSARRSALDARLLHPMLRQADGTLRARRAGTTRSTASPTAFADIIERDGPGRGRVLSLRPVADRGLLRRQQADEGLPRLGQCRHQFAPVHGVVGRRPPPRLRRRHRARHLRRSRRGRSDRAGRLQRRLVPSGAVPAHGAQQGASAAPRSSSSIRAAPRPATTPTCSCRSRPAWTRRCSAACWCISPSTARSTTSYIDAHTTGFDEALARATRDRARRRRDRARDRPRRGATSRASSSCSARTERVVTCYLAGRQPVGAGHRQGQRHHQLPSRHRPHRQARHGAVLADRPAQRHGRPRGRRARQPARRAHGLLAGRGRSRAAASGTRRAWPSARASRPCRCSRRSRAARSRRCG